MESSPHLGTTSSQNDQEGMKLGMANIAKRPCSVILEEKIEDNFQPTEEGSSARHHNFIRKNLLASSELLEYALWLGMTIPRDMDLIWIARDGLTQPLPEEWKPCQTEDDEIYYFNFETGESVWDHPCDGVYRKLYQEECKKLGKRPNQMRGNSNWGEVSAHHQSSHPKNYDEMLPEDKKHSPRRPTLPAEIASERLPSNKEIQMNIVAKEIDSLKGIRDQLLQKMNEVWQGDQFSPLASQIVVERVANFNELLPGTENIPSLEVDHFTQLNTQGHAPNWNNLQLVEEEDPTTTKQRTEMLRKQLEMARTIPAQIASRVGGDHIHDHRPMYEDHQKFENQLNGGHPIMYASKASQDGNVKHPFVSDARDVLHRVKEELKKEELIIVDEMKERILMQVRKTVEVFERSAIEEHELVLTSALTRKKESLELFRKELRKNMELELLLEEEVILNRKREELLTRIRNIHVGQQSFVEQQGGQVTRAKQLVNGLENDRMLFPKDKKSVETSRIQTSVDSICPHHETLATTVPEDNACTTQTREVRQKNKEALHHRSACDKNSTYEDEKHRVLDRHGVSCHLYAAPKELPNKTSVGVDEDWKKLFLQYRRELRDDIASLTSKMNEILTSHAKANQLNLETSSLSPFPMEDKCETSHDAVPVHANLTQMLYRLKRSIGELDANLKCVFHERKVLRPASKGSVHENPKELQSGIFFIDSLPILKEWLVVMGKELEKSIHHLDQELIARDKFKHKSPHDEALDMKMRSKKSTEMLSILTRLLGNIDKLVENQAAREQQQRCSNKALGCGSNIKETPFLKYDCEAQPASPNEELVNRILGVHDVVTEFKSISTDLISSFKGFIGQLDSEMKQQIQQYRRKVKCEVNDFATNHHESRKYGDNKLKNQLILPTHGDYSVEKTLEGGSGVTVSFENRSVDALVTLEQFIGELQYKLRDHVCCCCEKANDTDGVEMDYHVDSTCATVKQNVDFLLHETSMEEVEKKYSRKICRTSATPINGSSIGVSSKAECNSKDFVGGLNAGNLALIQTRLETAEDKISTFPIRSTTERNHDSQSPGTSPANQFVLPKMHREEISNDYNLQLETVSTEPRYATFEEFQGVDFNELPNPVSWETGEREVDTSHFELKRMDDNCASFSDGTAVETCGNSTTGDNYEMIMTDTVHSIHNDIMQLGLEGFISKVDEELKSIIQSCRRDLKIENGRNPISTNGMEHREFHPQVEETELECKSFISMLKGWTTHIEKATRHVLEHFKSKLEGEVILLQQQKTDEPSTLLSVECDKLQAQKPQHVVQGQTLMAEERHIWYDILNDATKQWLQKEWVERLSEHQSDLTMTCDNSISPPNSESFAPVQKGLGDDNKAMHGDNSSDSNKKWLVQHSNPLRIHTTSEVKERTQETSKFSMEGFTNNYLSCTTSRHNNCTCEKPCEGKEFESGLVNVERQSSDEVHLELGERNSILFTNNLKVMGCLPNDLGVCLVESSCLGRDDGNMSRHNGVDKLQSKLIHDNSVSQNNHSSIDRWISKTELFGAFNHISEVGVSEAGGCLCEECLNQNILIHATQSEVRNKCERVRVLRSMSQLKLVSKRRWQNLQSMLRVREATRWAYVFGSWAIGKMSCSLLLKKHGLYPTFALRRSIKALVRKSKCGKAYPSTRFEDVGDERERDNYKQHGSDDPGDDMVHSYCCNYPFVTPFSRRYYRKENINNSSSAKDIESFHQQKLDIAYGEAKPNFPGQRKLPHPSNMDERSTKLSNNPEKCQNRNDLILADKFKEYQSDDENAQCDCQIPVTKSINLRGVNMYELEEAINNLRKSRELEARSKKLRVNIIQVHRNDDHFEDDGNGDVKSTPKQVPTSETHSENGL